MSTNTETIDRIDRRYYSNINHALVGKAKTLADGIRVMIGVANMRMKQDVISTSDRNAVFIADNDVPDKNCCVASMKEMNAALEVKVKEMEKTMQTFTDFACRGL